MQVAVVHFLVPKGVERNKVVVFPISLSLEGVRINTNIHGLSLESACYNNRECIQVQRSCLGLLGRICMGAKNDLKYGTHISKGLENYPFMRSIPTAIHNHI